jgi:hypothetical protein
MPVCLPTHLPINQSNNQSINLSTYLLPTFYLSIYLSIYLSVCLSIYLFFFRIYYPMVKAQNNQTVRVFTPYTKICNSFINSWKVQHTASKSMYTDPTNYIKK